MFETLNSYVEQGLLSRKVSPCGELVLYDYTEKCQWEKAWDEITLNHRGTVYSLETGEVVARSFPKFFNFSELSPEEQKTKLYSKDFRVYTKMDGSLGIIYYYGGEWRVNTRGSFVSDQAIKAKELLDNMYTGSLNIFTTYLVEIIYPENRIVVDYNGMEDLVLLGAINVKTGEEYDISTVESCFEKEAPTCIYNSISEVLARLKTLNFNQEGYVVQFQDGSRAKFKGDEYVEMHRLISGLSPLTIWERMENGVVKPEFLATIPEEFRDQYEVIAKTLEENAGDLMHRINFYAGVIISDLFNGKFEATGENRKTLGLYLKENEMELNQYIFPYMLGKSDVVWKMVQKEIRPTGNHL